MIAIPIIQTIVFTTYVAWVGIKYGPLSSLSDSWYVEGKKNYLFTLFIFTLAVTTCLLSEWPFVVSGGLLGLVGAATAFKQDPMTGVIHSIGATGSIVMALVGLAMHGIWGTAVVSVAVALIVSDKRLKITDPTRRIEILTFGLIQGGLFGLATR